MVEYLLATEEQKQIAELAGRIVARELAPQLETLEHANEGRGAFSKDVARTLAKAGFASVSIPKKWGGLELDLTTICLIGEEMAKIDAGFAFNFLSIGLNWKFLEQTGLSDEEKRRYADGYHSGERMSAFCLTEAQAGSDTSRVATTAYQDGDEWVINGRKCFVTGGYSADHYFVVAWTDKTKSQGKGMTMFLVERERPGVSVGKLENKMGLKTSETCDVIFDEVRVPTDHVVGTVGRGLIVSLGHLHVSRCYAMSFALGIADAAIDYAVKYAQERETWGKPVIQHQGLGFLLADMKMRTDASRALLYQTAAAVDRGLDIGTLSSSVKAYVSDCTMQTTTDAVQVLGGYGYMKDYPVEKLMRDAKIFQIFDGTNQIQRWLIARDLEKKKIK